MKRILFIYPYLTSYILPVLRGIAESGKVYVDVLYGPLPSGQGFGDYQPFSHPNIHWTPVQELRPFGNRIGMYQRGVLRHIIKTCPDVVLHWANARYASFWGVLILGRLKGIPVFPRGHGLVKKVNPSLLQKIMYKAILKLSTQYICYTPKVMESLEKITDNSKKLTVDFNTLYNTYPVLPNEKTGRENGIFYIGRVRADCGVDVAIRAIQRINQTKEKKIEFHVIGDGPMGSYLRKQAQQLPWLKYYGRIFDQLKISEISRKCRVGCVPGFMGLNAVHMMSLSLPVVTHGQLHRHMGPEPEYIQHEQNGLLMERPNELELVEAILRKLWTMNNSEILSLQKNAYATYNKLSTPPFHDRIINILGGISDDSTFRA